MSDQTSNRQSSSTKAHDVTLKIQAVWSEDSVLHEFAMDYVDIVNTIGAGRVRLSRGRHG